MSEFKPMVKMYTDEPSVSLKLKKGGKVKAKHHKEHEEHGHKNMQHHAMGGMHHAFESEHGKAPKKPSMMERMKAMNPNQYKKGGKVAHKVMGGGMPMANPAMGSPMGAMRPMGAKAIGAMNPQARNARAMAVRKALTGMKKGGSADHKMIEKLEKELHHHESLPMAKAHKKASGGAIDRDETRTTIEKGAKKFEKTKMDTAHKDRAHGTGEIHEDRAGGYKHGGKVHKISGHPEGSMEHHKAMCKYYEKCHKEGGSAHHKKMAEHHKKMCKGGNYATGGSIPADTHESKNKAKTKFGGTYEGNEHDYVNTEMHSAKKDKAHGTGGIKETNAGGFKRGGRMHHKATGGAIPAATEKSKREGHLKNDAYEGGDWENRAADTATAGKKNGKTGQVNESNAGGYKHGGHASKKHYATGGDVDMGQADRSLRQSSRGDKKLPDMRALTKAAKAMGYESYMDVPDSRAKEFHELKKKHGYANGGTVDDGKAVKMPKHFVSRPVANSLQSGTFKKGGKVKKFDDGGSTSDDKYIVKDPKAVSDKASRELEDAMNPLSMAKELYGKAKNYFSPPAGSVTKTEKSVTVSPGKKRGGSMKR